MADSTVIKLAQGTLWLTTAGLLVNALQLFSTIIAAWYLSPADFGLVAIAIALMAIVDAVSNLQLGESLIRLEDLGERDIDCIWTLGAMRGLVVAILLCSMAWPVASFYDDDRLISVMQALSIGPLVAGLQNPRRYVQQRKLIFRQEFIIVIFQKVTSFVATVSVAFLYQSYWALIVGNIVFSLAGAVMSFLVLQYRPRFGLAGVREVFGFSAWLTLGNIVNTLNWRFEFLLIGKILGTTSLGLYQMGSNFAQLPTREIMSPLKKVIYPGLTRVVNDPASKKNPGRVRTAYQRAQAAATLIALPIGVGFAIVADPFVRIVLPDRWYPAIFILQYLSAVFAFQTLGSLVQPLGWAKNRTRWLFIRDCWMLGIRLPIIVIGMALGGLPGVVVARIVSGVIGAGFNMFLVRRLIDLPIVNQLKANWRAIASIAVTAVAMLTVERMFATASAASGDLLAQLFLQVLVAIVLYPVLTWILWRFSGRVDGPEVEICRLLAHFAATLWGRRASGDRGHP